MKRGDVSYGIIALLLFSFKLSFTQSNLNSFSKKQFELHFDSLLYEGQSEETLTFLDQWLTKANQIADSTTALELVYNKYGTLFYDMGKYEEAKQYYLKSISYGLITKDTSQLIRPFYSIAVMFFQLGDYAEAERYIESALNNVRKEDSNYSILHNTAGQIYQNLGNFERAESLFQTSLASIDKDKEIIPLIQTMICLGNLEYDRGMYYKALEYYQKTLVLEIEDRESLWLKLGVLLNIGNIYSEIKDFDLALSFFNQAKALSDQHDYKKFHLTSLIKLSRIRLELSDTIGLSDQLAKQLSISKESDDVLSLLETMNQVVTLRLQAGHIDEAVDIAKNAISISQTLDDYYLKGLSYLTLGLGLIEKKSFKAAQANCLKAKENSDVYSEPSLKLEIYECLYSTAIANKDYRTAFDYLYQYQVLNDSLLNEESIRKVNTLTVQQEYDKKMLVERLKNEEEQRISETKLQQQRKVQILMSILFFLSLLSLAIIYYNARLNKRYIKQLEKLNLTLQEKRKEVIIINRRVDQFAHSVSHDIINRLNNIALSGQLINQQELSGLQSFRKKTINSVNNLSIYCTNLLTWSEHPSQQFEENTNLNEIVQKIIEEYQPLIEQNEVMMMVFELPTVKLSSSIAEQVLGNLIDNALKYSKLAKPNPCITIDAEKTEKNWKIKVKDNGKGIPKDQLETVFQQTENSRGLSFVKQNLAFYGYQIWAENNSQGGTTFYFTVGVSDLQESPNHVPVEELNSNLFEPWNTSQ